MPSGLFREVYVAILGDFWETNIGIGECSQPKVSLSCLREFSFCCDIWPWSGKFTNKSMLMKMIASIWWRYPIVPRPDLNQKKQTTNFPRSFADFLCGEFEKDQRGRVAHRERSGGDIYGCVWCLNCLAYVWGSACKKRNARRDMWMFIAKYRSFSFYMGVTWSKTCFFPFEFDEPCRFKISVSLDLWPPNIPPTFRVPKLQEVDAAEKLAVHRVPHLHRMGTDEWSLSHGNFPPASGKTSRELNE